MQARAAVLLSEQTRWSRGTSKETGQPFWLIPGSKGTAHYTTAFGCTCKSFTNRGTCSHVVAVQQYEDRLAEAETDAAHEYAIEQAFADVAATRRQPIRSCADLFPPSDFD
jgi:hypothetical protein